MTTDGLLSTLSATLPVVSELTHGVSPADQVERGYGYTLREICRQPEVWRTLGIRLADEVSETGVSTPPLLLTGSGSSYFIGAALAPALQRSLKVPVRAVPSGELLLAPDDYLDPGSAPTVVSFGRSGDSPESVAVVEMIGARDRRARQVCVTCNPAGRLATGYGDDARVRVILLGREVDDQSLVMTSSFTAMWLAGRALGRWPDGAAFERRSAALGRAGRATLETWLEPLARIARQPFAQAWYLGSSSRFGAAREAELKMLEMCAGRVSTRAETFLGLRHGPMAGVGHGTLIVAFVSSEVRRRAFELDLLSELSRKHLGLGIVACGVDLPLGVAGDAGLAVDYGPADDLDDDDAVPLDVLVGQTLGFFRCLHEGLKPDAPSADDVITRVVPPFRIHPV